MQLTDEQKEIRKVRLAPFMWKPGQSGNPSGRPKGKTVKERAREALMRLSDAEFDKFLLGMNKYDVWRMAEGNPAQDLTSGGEKLKVLPIYGGASINGVENGSTDTSEDLGASVQEHDGDEKDILPQEEN